jgi:hypothetical protein
VAGTYVCSYTPLAAGTAATDTFVLASLATDNIHETSQVTTVAICKTHF